MTTTGVLPSLDFKNKMPQDNVREMLEKYVGVGISLDYFSDSSRSPVAVKSGIVVREGDGSFSLLDIGAWAEINDRYPDIDCEISGMRPLGFYGKPIKGADGYTRICLRVEK